MLRVGLSGYGNISTGLGQLNSMLWRNLPFSARYVQKHSKFGTGPMPIREVDCSNNISEVLDKIDVLVFVERPFPEGSVQLAKTLNKRVVCVPMCEWTPRTLDWLPDVDLFVAVTDQCRDYMVSLGYEHKTVRLQCPIDLDEFPFRERTSVESVVYLDGWGGSNERKGWRSVQTMLLSSPRGYVRVKSQRGLHRSEPAAEHPADLYHDADCILMPSRYDGLGLTMLEAMASGCPVLATDAPPYNEFMRAAYGDLASGLLLPVKDVSQVRVWSHTWPAANVDVRAMKVVVERIKHATSDEIAEASHAGRDYIEREHGTTALEKLWGAICDAR